MIDEQMELDRRREFSLWRLLNQDVEQAKASSPEMPVVEIHFTGGLILVVSAADNGYEDWMLSDCSRSNGTFFVCNGRAISRFSALDESGVS